MTTYYNETWHKLPLEERIKQVEIRYFIEGELLEIARKILQASSGLLNVARELRQIRLKSPSIGQSRDGLLLLIDKIKKRPAFQNYIDALRRYLIVKQEYDRLTTIWAEQQTLANPKPPNLPGRGQSDRQSKPHGMTPESESQSPDKPTQTDIDFRILQAERWERVGDEQRVDAIFEGLATMAEKIVDESLVKFKEIHAKGNENDTKAYLDVLLADFESLDRLGSPGLGVKEQEVRKKKEHDIWAAIREAAKDFVIKSMDQVRKVRSDQNIDLLLENLKLFELVGGDRETLEKGLQLMSEDAK
jgi:hypothetical protein